MVLALAPLLVLVCAVKVASARGGTVESDVLSIPESSTLVLLGIGAVSLLAAAWRRRQIGQLASAAAVLLVLSVGVAQAQVSNVFNMPAGDTSLQFVTVGDPGNVADTPGNSGNPAGQGAVSYDYKLGEYDVTVDQYVQFLNAVAKTDTYGLYNSSMATGPEVSNQLPTIGIIQSGSSGGYSYSITGGDSQAANCPIFNVTWGDAARFCNWLQNDQPVYPVGTPGEVAGSTETGAYMLNGAVSNAALLAITRNPGATYFIPSEDEWYKAAFYKGGSTNAGYWSYPTQSNTAPINTLPDTGNHANFFDLYGTGNHNYTDPTNYLTPVGSFSESPGRYGTFDMGGDVWQWNESIVSGSWRGIRGGAFYGNSGNLMADARLNGDPASEFNYLGFRVAGDDPGDANGDGKVDINDLTIVLAHYGETSGMTWSQGDFTGDGKVDINDLTIVLANYDNTVGSDIKSVPEPSCIVLLAIGAVGLLGYGWRRRRQAA
jgi:formylglycine-generating enzyme required for sulfatase activity